MDDAEDEEDTVVGDEVVHDPVVAHSQAMEGVSLTPDRSHLLAADTAGTFCRFGEALEACADPRTQRRRELLEGAPGRGREPDLVGVAQAMSRSEVDRPR
jgi:hypothetical protein